jgi:hypothetical protein
VPAPDDYDDGEIGGMMIGKETKVKRQKKRSKAIPVTGRGGP